MKMDKCVTSLPAFEVRVVLMSCPVYDILIVVGKPMLITGCLLLLQWIQFYGTSFINIFGKKPKA